MLREIYDQVREHPALQIGDQKKPNLETPLALKKAKQAGVLQGDFQKSKLKSFFPSKIIIIEKRERTLIKI